eukprot:501598-Prorocentrum_minimum.AAC.2
MRRRSGGRYRGTVEKAPGGGPRDRAAEGAPGGAPGAVQSGRRRASPRRRGAPPPPLAAASAPAPSGSPLRRPIVCAPPNPTPQSLASAPATAKSNPSSCGYRTPKYRNS